MRTQTSQKAELFARALRMIILGVFALFAGTFFASLALSAKTDAATSSTVNFQARLETAAGATAPDGDYNVEFKLYDAASSSGSSQGSCSGDVHCVWVETRTSTDKVHVANGYLTVNLGSVTAFGSINWNQQLWLTMNIGGTGAASWDGEMSPRLLLTATPYAFQAGQLATTSSGNTATLGFTTPTGTRSILLPDASGTVCLQTSSSCGFLTSTTGVQLQGSTPGSAQTGNFNITGTGIAGTFNGNSVLLGQAGSTTGTLVFNNSTNSNTLTLQAGATGGNLTWTLPTNNGSNGYVLTTNGSGTLSWSPASCSNCVLNDSSATDTTNTIVPTNDVTSLTVRQTSNGTPTKNIFAITNSGNTTTYASLGSDATWTLNSGSSKAFSLQQAGNEFLGISTAGAVTLQSRGTNQNLTLNASGSGVVTTTSRMTVLSANIPTSSYGLQVQPTINATFSTVAALVADIYAGTPSAKNTTNAFSLIATVPQVATAGAAILIPSNGSSYFGDSLSAKYALYSANTSDSYFAGGLQAAAGAQSLSASQFVNNPSLAGSSSNVAFLVAKGQTSGSGAATEPIVTGLAADGAALTKTSNVVTNAAGAVITLPSIGSGNIGLFISSNTTYNGGAPGSGTYALYSANTAASLLSGSLTGTVATFTGASSLTLGAASSHTGAIILQNATNSNTLTIQSGVTSTSYTLTLPTAVGSSGDCLKATNGTGTLGWGSCGSGGSFVTLQGSTPGTADTGNFNISGTGIAGVLQAGTLALTGTGGQTFTTPQSNSKSTQINIPLYDPGAFNSVINFGIPTTANVSARVLTLYDGRTSAVTQPALAVASPDENSVFGLGWEGSNTTAAIRTQGSGNPGVKIELGATPTTVATFNVTSNGGANLAVPLTLSGTGTSSFTTPGGSTVQTKVNIPLFDPGDFGQLIALGLPSTSAFTTSRVLSLFDGRSSAHQPTIAVFNPGESDAVGFSWDGSSSQANIKTLGADIGIVSNATTIATFQPAAINLVQATLVKKTSATALQVQNGSSSVLLTADTSAMQVVVGSTSNGLIMSSSGLTAAGTAQHTKTILLTPEFEGAVLDAASDTGGANCSTNNAGTMTSGYANSITSFGNTTQNYYKWTTASGTNQCYDVVVQVMVPADFSSWASSTPVSVNAYTSNTTNGLLNLQAIDSAGTTETNCNYVSVTPGSTTTWSTNSSACTIAGTYTAGSYMTLRIRMTSPTSGDVRLGNIKLQYKSSF